jgi:hypothetical protein
MPSGQSQQVCQTFTVAQFPLDKLAEVHCFSFSREAYDLEARSGYRCVDPTCPDGASISGITLENVTTNGTPGVKACATLTNSSPRRKTLAVDFTFRH